MNRGVLQSSPVQQLMAAGGPNWWNINSNMRPSPPPPPPHSQLISHPNFMAPPPNNLFPPYAPPPPSSSSSSLSWHDHIQEAPESWSQLLMGGIVIENQDKSGLNHIQPQAKKLENWEEQLLHQHQQQIAPNSDVTSEDHIKQENSTNSYHHQLFGNTNAELIHTTATAKPSWPQMMPVSSPKSCVTSLSSNMLDFSNNKADGRLPPPDRSSECNSAATGEAAKKARVQPSSSTQSTFKVRKEKLGDRITALHQLVSPFGKTDTASVLLEAIGYIRFLQSQIEALSLPYLGSGSGNNMRPQQQQQQQQYGHGERSCLFPEDPGQLLNDNNCLKRKVAPDQEGNEEGRKDLRSRGLCLVPISCTVQVGSDNGAEYWAPAAIGGGFQ